MKAGAAECAWLAVGRRSARALEGAGKASSDGTAESVHEAVVRLATDARRPALVDAETLLPKPRSALRALRSAAAPERVVVLTGDTLDPRVERAARGARVAIVRDLAELRPVAARPAPERADDEAESEIPEGPAPRPRATPVDRAAGPAPDSPSFEARFVDGCFRRLERTDDLCRYVLRGFARRTGARRTSLLLLDAGRSTLFVKAARGIDETLVGRVRQPLQSGISGRAASLGRAVTGYASRGGARGYQGTAYVVLPLGRGAACEGVVAMSDLPDDRVPDAEALRSLVRMASRAGRAISAARRLEHAETLSATDELTQLPNRRAFERAAHREIERARRTGTRLALGLLDVDHFKSLNDRYGHPVGDRVLVQVARRLAGAFRETDLVSRWGGEEFAVLLTGLGEDAPAEALAVLERARHAVGSRPLALGPGLPCPVVSVSGGVSVFPADGSDTTELMRKADGALYEAKRTGRDRVLHA